MIIIIVQLYKLSRKETTQPQRKGPRRPLVEEAIAAKPTAPVAPRVVPLVARSATKDSWIPELKGNFKHLLAQ